MAKHAPIIPTIIPGKLNPLSVGDAGAIKPKRSVPKKPPTILTITFAIHPICPSTFIIIEAIHPIIPAKIKVIISPIYSPPIFYIIFFLELSLLSFLPLINLLQLPVLD
jgi:hypothetical protein